MDGRTVERIRPRNLDHTRRRMAWTIRTPALGKVQGHRCGTPPFGQGLPFAVEFPAQFFLAGQDHSIVGPAQFATQRTLLGFPVNSPRLRHDRFDRVQTHSKGFAGALLPVFESEGLFLAASVAVVEHEGLDAGKEFKQESRGDVG